MRTATRAILGFICVLGAVISIPVDVVSAAPDDPITIQVGVGQLDFQLTPSVTGSADCDAIVVDDNSGGQSFRVAAPKDCLDTFLLVGSLDGLTGNFVPGTFVLEPFSVLIDGSERAIRLSPDLSNEAYAEAAPVFFIDDSGPIDTGETIKFFASTKYPSDAVLLEVAASDGTFAGQELSSVVAGCGDFLGDIIADNPVAWWRFGDSAVIEDSVGSVELTATETLAGSAPVTETSPVVAATLDGALALEFDAVTASEDSATSPLFPAGDFTIEGWSEGNTTFDYFVQLGEGVTLSYFSNDGEIQLVASVRSAGGESLLSYSDAESEEAVHVAVTRSGDENRLYYNGELVDTDESTGSMEWGVGSQEVRFEGAFAAVDEWAIYDSALTAIRVLGRYQTGSCVDDTGGGMDPLAIGGTTDADPTITPIDGTLFVNQACVTLADTDGGLDSMACFATASERDAYLESAGLFDATSDLELLGTHFDRSRNRSLAWSDVVGPSLAVVGATCLVDVVFVGTSWDNTFSSTRNGCPTAVHYESFVTGPEIDVDGAFSGQIYRSIGEGANALGFLNNRTSAIRYLPAGVGPPVSEKGGLDIVVLGESYASGNGAGEPTTTTVTIGSLDGPPTTVNTVFVEGNDTVQGCGRNLGAWGQLYTNSLLDAGFSVRFTNAACSGAKLYELTETRLFEEDSVGSDGLSLNGRDAIGGDLSYAEVELATGVNLDASTGGTDIFTEEELAQFARQTMDFIYGPISGPCVTDERRAPSNNTYFFLGVDRTTSEPAAARGDLGLRYRCGARIEAQIESVNSGTDLVLLTASGTDAGFGNIVRQCFATVLGRNDAACDDVLSRAERVVIDGEVIQDDDGPVETLEVRLLNALLAIHDRGENAEVHLLDYPYLISDTDISIGSVEVGARLRRLQDRGSAVQRAVVARANFIAGEEFAFYIDDVKALFGDNVPTLADGYEQNLESERLWELVFPLSAIWHPKNSGQQTFSDALVGANVVDQAGIDLPARDIVFLVNATAHDADTLAQFQDVADLLFDVTADANDESRVAVVSYRDIPEQTGNPADYPARIEIEFTTDRSGFLNAVAGIQSGGGGGGTPDSLWSAFDESFTLNWRKSANKQFVVVGDQTPYTTEPETGLTEFQIGAGAYALNPAEIYVFSTSAPSAALATLAQESGGLHIGTEPDTLGETLLSFVEGGSEKPLSVPAGPYAGRIGEPMTLDARGSFDAQTSIALYEWDLDGDRNYETSTDSPILTTTFTSEYVGTIGLRVTDTDGFSHIATTQVTVTADGDNADNDNCPAVSNADQSDIDQDGIGDVCDSVFTISPPIANSDSGTVNVGETQSFDVLANDVDSEDDLLPGTLVIYRDGTLGTAEVIETNGDFVVTYSAGTTAGEDEVDYIVCDFAGFCRSATLTITIESDTEPPTGSPCDSLTPTIEGTNASETINGTTGDDIIFAYGGNDKINGKGGNDIVCAGSGNDTINLDNGDDIVDTGPGDDKVNAKNGDNTVYALEGNNTINGGTGIDTVYAGPGNDTINSKAGDDVIDAGDGNNTVNASDGNDVVVSGTGTDVLNLGGGNDIGTAGPGDDRINAGSGSDTADGGPGNDTCFGEETNISCEL